MKDIKVLTKNDWLDCDGCNKKLEPVFWEKEWNDQQQDYILKETCSKEIMLNQINDGLNFKIYGGYGEFFDSFIAGPIELNLCKDCCEKMFLLFNKTKKLFILEEGI